MDWSGLQKDIDAFFDFHGQILVFFYVVVMPIGGVIVLIGFGIYSLFPKQEEEEKKLCLTAIST